MLSIRITGTEAVRDRFRGLPAEVIVALTTKVYALTLELETHVKRDKLSGQVLHAITGRLRRSIHSSVTSNGDTVTGKVFSSGDVPYAAIHEFGGRTAPHDIYSVKAKALAFMQNGKIAFYKHVRHPGSKIPQRSYLRSSLDDMRQHIIDEMKNAVEEALK